MGRIDYVKLYALQDRVLDKIFSFEHDLYLTGGTCLSRFYKVDPINLFPQKSDFNANGPLGLGFPITICSNSCRCEPLWLLSHRAVLN